MDLMIPEPTPPTIIQPSLFGSADLQIDSLLDAPRAREVFGVDGIGHAVAVPDTGLRVTHQCFFGRVLEARSYTFDDGGAANVVTDRNGHGTNVTGLIAASTNDERRGIASGASIVALEVLPAPTMSPIVDALNWVGANAARLGITVVNMSRSTPGINLVDDAQVRSEHPQLASALTALTDRRIAVVVAAGNDY